MSTPHAGPSKHTYPIHHAEYAMPSPSSPTTPEESESDRETWSPETSPTSSDSSESSSPPSPSRTTKSPSSPTLHPYRPKSRPATTSCAPKINLPKSQPLARALFARMAMAEIPSANGKKGSQEGKGGGKQKLIVATKPMRTTFELGLTSSELARRA